MSRYRYPVKFRYPVVSVSGKILPDIYWIIFLVFETGEIGVKTLERELKLIMFDWFDDLHLHL